MEVLLLGHISLITILGLEKIKKKEVFTPLFIIVLNEI
jgi:hypothetical protein